MQFSEVIGQQVVKEHLIQMVRGNRVSHAQLFLGMEGTGNLPMAIAFAQYISCTNRLDNDSCGTCSSCIKYNNLVHPDLHFVFPTASLKEITKPTSSKFLIEWREALGANPYLSLNQWNTSLGIENKQISIHAEDCNEIIKKLSLKSFESEYKITIIWRPERLFHSAAPKLLKILEEPPDKTLFILVAENHEQIINTIRSRTQLVKFKRIGDDDMRTALAGKFSIEGQKADYIVRNASGNFTEAIRIIETSENKEYNVQEFKNWMRLCFKRDVLSLMKWVDEMAKIGREKQKGFIFHALQMLRESILINYNIHDLVKVEGEERSFASKFSPFVNPGNCIELVGAMNTAYFNVERNANPRILFLDLSLQVVDLLKRGKE